MGVDSSFMCLTYEQLPENLRRSAANFRQAPCIEHIVGAQIAKLIVMARNFVGWHLFGGLVLVALLGGCGSQATTTSDVADEKYLKPLVVLYGQFIGQHAGRVPGSEQEFKNYIAKRAELLKQFNVDANTIFISQRDQQPFKVYYGLRQGYDGVIAHEQTGVNGVRLVGYSIGAIVPLNQEEFQKLKLPGK
jgi:hypothetical protein